MNYYIVVSIPEGIIWLRKYEKGVLPNLKRTYEKLIKIDENFANFIIETFKLKWEAYYPKHYYYTKNIK